MKKIVYIAPHLSTGGMPQYLVKQIESIKDDFEVYCIEWDNVTGGVLVVQRNKMVNLLGNRLITLGEDKQELFKVLDTIKPDVLHLQEIPELFMQSGVADRLYTMERDFTIIETSHDSGYNVNNKVYLPDKFLMVSQYQIDLYSRFGIPIDLVEYPIENKIRTKTREEALAALGLDPAIKHVINVGLFTPRKNQAEIIEYARILQNYPIQFHFIGNQADNFKFYWEPLMQNFPSNCKWWNERSDVDTFYEAADLFLFTSRGHSTDMETMPLVIRESLGWKVPSLIYNLPVYKGYFDKYDTIEYLTDNLQINAQRIAQKMMNVDHGKIYHTLNGKEKLEEIPYLNTTMENLEKYGDGAAQYFSTFIQKELERGDMTINAGDVFVDLGANIGMSALYARHKGAGEIHCFEPDARMVDILHKNVPSARTYPYAITNEPSELELYHWPFNPWNDGPKYKCTGITLKRVMEIVGKKIDYLKMDIEGYEVTAFDSVTATDCANIDRMMVEYHLTTGLNEFCDKLRSKGFEIQYIERGYQSYIYAQYKGVTTQDYGFNSNWNLDTQTVEYSVQTSINFPVLVSLKEYKSDGVLWSSVMDTLPAGCLFWMIPVPKHIHSYADDPNIMGVKFCVYNNVTGEQLYERPFTHRFTNAPEVPPLSNSIPYHVNYTEYFIQEKYGKWLKKDYDLVIDAGANVGVFSWYMLMNGHANHIVAIECDPIAILDLRRNFKHNNRLTLVEKALHSSSDGVVFYHSPDNPVISSTLSPDRLELHMAGVKGNVERIVPTVTIKELVDTYKTIDLLKIDIEGGEYDVLMNADDSLFSHINHIFLECHFFERDYKEKYEKLITKLTSVGYSIEPFKTNLLDLAGASECIYTTKEVK